eukprot:5389448-Prymnesium_polylepis.1
MFGSDRTERECRPTKPTGSEGDAPRARPSAAMFPAVRMHVTRAVPGRDACTSLFVFTPDGSLCRSMYRKR